jgi:hypothetical protein
MRLTLLEPCRESWDAMERRGPGRHCARCDRTVLDLTRLTERDALRALRRDPDGGGRCVRFLATDEGDLVFRRDRRRPGAASLVAAAAIGLAACRPGSGGDGGAPTDGAAGALEAPVDPGALGPMEPVDGAALAALERPAPDAPTLPLVSEPGRPPSAAQRALSARKHRREAPPPPPRTRGYPMMGGIALHD